MVGMARETMFPVPGAHCFGMVIVSGTSWEQTARGKTEGGLEPLALPIPLQGPGLRGRPGPFNGCASVLRGQGPLLPARVRC